MLSLRLKTQKNERLMVNAWNLCQTYAKYNENLFNIYVKFNANIDTIYTCFNLFQPKIM